MDDGFAPFPGAGVLSAAKVFPFGTPVSYKTIFTKKQTACNGNVKFSTRRNRVLIVWHAILFYGKIQPGRASKNSACVKNNWS
jgi:hypothetical protein